MTKLSRITVLCLATWPALGYLPSVSAAELIPPKLATEAKLSEAEARALAFKAFPGDIDGMELERVPGGSGLRYSFVMQKGDEHRTVAVDAKTGRILEIAQIPSGHESE